MSDSKEIDKKTIESAIKGESSAFGLIYDRYQPGIYRFVYLKVSHREEAEDLTHQVFLSAWQSITRFREEGVKISSWLYKIARNKVIDYYRTKKSLVDIPDEMDDTVFSLSPSEEIDIDKKMSLEKVKKALGVLNQDQRDVLIMKFVEELSYQEICDAMGKSNVSVRVIQHRAIKNIKKILEEGDK